MDNITSSKENPPCSPGRIFYLRQSLLLIFFLGAGSFILNAQPKLNVKDSKENFGFVKRGTVVTKEYEICNAGNEPLLIRDAEIACSCTTVDFPKQPLLPGQKALVIIHFNTASVYGRQDRTVYLLSNDPKGRSKLRYKGVVVNN